MNKQNQNELYFLDILKFFAAISIAVLLHYNDHFLPFLIRSINLLPHLIFKSPLVYKIKFLLVEPTVS